MSNLPPFINELRALEKEATPGMWNAENWSCFVIGTEEKYHPEVCHFTRDMPGNPLIGHRNADFIAALRNAFHSIVALAEENERLKKIVEAGEEFADDVGGMEGYDDGCSGHGVDCVSREANEFWISQCDAAIKKYREAKV